MGFLTGNSVPVRSMHRLAARTGEAIAWGRVRMIIGISKEKAPGGHPRAWWGEGAAVFHRTIYDTHSCASELRPNSSLLAYWLVAPRADTYASRALLEMRPATA